MNAMYASFDLRQLANGHFVLIFATDRGRTYVDIEQSHGFASRAEAVEFAVAKLREALDADVVYFAGNRNERRTVKVREDGRVSLHGETGAEHNSFPSMAALEAAIRDKMYTREPK